MASAGSPGALVTRNGRDAALFAGGLVLAVALHVFDPAGVTTSPLCPFYAITGLYCPGCGTLRCLHALLQGDLGSAVGYNVMTVVLMPVLLVAWLSVGVAAIGGRYPPWIRSLPAWSGRAIAAAVGLFWVLRNVPVEPLAWMAP